MRTRTLLGAAIVCCLAAQPLRAETRVLASAGGWQAFGGTTLKGRPVCGMSSSGNGRYFGIKYFAGDDTLTIQLGSNRGRIENGAKQRLQMRFDAERPWNATGTGMHFNDGDAGLEYAINRTELAEFVREFSDSARITVTFIGSNAAPWSGSLAGTRAIVETFERCVRTLR
jgi:hypothetical protein